jgi:hypothetical protein
MVDTEYMVFDSAQLIDSELPGYEADGVNASLIFVDNLPGQGLRRGLATFAPQVRPPGRCPRVVPPPRQ